MIKERREGDGLIDNLKSLVHHESPRKVCQRPRQDLPLKDPLEK